MLHGVRTDRDKFNAEYHIILCPYPPQNIIILADRTSLIIFLFLQQLLEYSTVHRVHNINDYLISVTTCRHVEYTVHL